MLKNKFWFGLVQNSEPSFTIIWFSSELNINYSVWFYQTIEMVQFILVLSRNQTMNISMERCHMYI
jgi:hypothetical protein